MDQPGRRTPRTVLDAREWVTSAIVAGAVAAATAHATPVCGSWRFVASATPPSGASTLAAVDGVSASDVWAVGYTADGTETLTLHWDGVAWSIVPAPNPSTFRPQNLLLGVDAIAPDDVWAVGLYNSDGGDSTSLPTAQSLAEHWNGLGWTRVGSPAVVGGSSFNAVCALASDDVWAVGTRALTGSSTANAPLTARWNGSSWIEVPAPSVGNRLNQLQGVSARTSSDAWAVGTWRSTPTTFHILILNWNGSSWSASSAPDPGISDQLFAVADLAADDAWAVGERMDPIEGSQPLIMHWDGAGWSLYPLPVFPAEFNRLTAIRAASSTDIWAVGAFATVAGDPPQPLLMHWDGSGWSTVASDPSGGTSENFLGLAVVSACDVWAVGASISGGPMIPLTERLQPVAVDVPGGEPGAAGRSVFLSLVAAPNPAYGQARVSMNLAHAAWLHAEVFDPRGRRVRDLAGRAMPAGTATMAWDGRDAAGAAAAPGVYFIRVSAGSEASVVRLILRR